MERSYNAEFLRRGAMPYPEILADDFDYEGWVANTNNILLIEGGDVGFFTYEYPGVYSPHYFLESRGKDAIDVTLRAFKLMFDEYGCKVLRGMTKTSLRAACWMARQYGFKSYGIVECLEGPHEIFIMTKDEFNLKHKDKKWVE